jgi:hypothetical protein
MLNGRFLMAARNVQGGQECREAFQREEIKIPTVGRNAPGPLSQQSLASLWDQVT